MIQHTLSPEDMAWAMEVGSARASSSAATGGRPNFAYSKYTSEQEHQFGAGGELAFCRALKLDWMARVDTFMTLPDVDPNWEVRSTEYRPHDPKARPKDPPTILIAHVTGHHFHPTYYIIGCVIAGWVQRTYAATDVGDRGSKVHYARERDLTPIDENFHVTHAWCREASSPSGWACAYCPVQYEGPVP